MLGVAAVLVVVADIGLRRLSPPKYVREVADAVSEYEHEDPTVLVLGSSHARTFTVMDGIVRERTGGRERILSVPVEFGKFRSYEWTLRHRIEPLIDEKVSSGAKKRPSLRRFVLQSAWWDACWIDGDPPVFNLPSRSWQFKDFIADVADKGVTDHNRNYVTSRWGELFHGSILVSDRGQNHLINALHDKIKPLSEESKKAQFERRLESWREIISRGKKCVGHPEEMAAAHRILDWAQGRGYDTSIMLYPMMPITITPETRVTVQEPFEELMKKVAEQHKIKIVDATFDNGGITDDDFQPDFDHLTPAGHIKLSEWLLANRMGWLLEPAPTHASSPNVTSGEVPR